MSLERFIVVESKEVFKNDGYMVREDFFLGNGGGCVFVYIFVFFCGF